jgi:heme/copper-type cytochrome/quinol oxidase subunit 1
MVLATIIRLELAYPGVGIFAGDSLQYLSMVTAHGVIMVFFMIMPLLFGAFGNFLLPTQLGVHDVAFPRLNSAAFWFLPAGLIMLGQLVCIDRRYQRMNCFNIREVQSLLKRKFFTDLINSHDHNQLLNNTMIGLKFKTNDFNVISPNTFLLFNFGTEINMKNRNVREVIDDTTAETTFSFMHSFIIYKKNLSVILGKITSRLFRNFSQNGNIFIYNVDSYYLFFSTLFSFSNLNYLISILTFNWIKFFFKFFYNLITAPFFILKQHTIDLVDPIEFYFLCLLVLDQSKNFYLSFKEELSKSVTLSVKILKNSPNSPLGIYLVNDFLSFYQSHLNLLFPTWRHILWGCEVPNLFTAQELDEEKKLLKSHVDNYMYNVSIFFLEISYKKHQKLLNYFESNRMFLVFKELQPFINKNSDSSWEYINIMKYALNNAWSLFLNVIAHLFDFTHYFFVLDVFYDFFINWQLPLLIDADWYFNFLAQFANTQVSSISPIIQISFIVKEFSSWFYHFIILFIWKLFLFHVSFIPPVRPLIDTTTATPLSSAYFLFGFIYHLAVESKMIWDFVTTLPASIWHEIYSSWKGAPRPTFVYNSEYFANMTLLELLKHSKMEFSSETRNQRFSNPVFKYDYKAGNYFPKLYKEIYTFLFSTFSDLTNALRPSPWFLALTFNDDFFSNFNLFHDECDKRFISQQKRIWTKSLFSATDGFYNFFFTLRNETIFLNQRWATFSSLNQKFQRMFTTSSMQQRIYSNWRQLKFTREAWRCKLLAARHQKTLYRRYVNEDGVFWSIERNAKDLLPGWAMITPFSSRTRFTAIGKVDIGLMGVFLVLNSSIISGANFLVTYRYLSTLNNRKMRDARAFFAEGVMVASWMMIAANPMLVIGIIMLLSDRHWQTSFFDYSGGGDTILFQHMFWFFGHPEVYVILIPVFGFTNTILSYYLRKRVSARASLLYSMYTIAFLGFFVWGHHMYMVGLAHTTRMLFSTLTVMISVPAATKLMHWCVTLVNSSFTMELPFLFVLTFIFFFVSGGISGMFVAHTGMDILFHDTFYVIGHFHVMLAGGAMFGSFGAFYFYFPAIFGVKYSRIYAYLHYTYYLIGQLMTVIPMFWLGYAGMPRRVLDYPASMGGWHSVISAGHLLSVAGLLAFFIMIFDSLRQGRAVIRNTFGINRYNTRLNFYLYEVARLTYIQQKASFCYKYVHVFSLKLQKLNYTNLEHLETTLYSYTFFTKR